MKQRKLFKMGQIQAYYILDSEYSKMEAPGWSILKLPALSIQNQV